MAPVPAWTPTADRGRKGDLMRTQTSVAAGEGTGIDPHVDNKEG
jgi:hypothetical protein